MRTRDSDLAGYFLIANFFIDTGMGLVVGMAVAQNKPGAPAIGAGFGTGLGLFAATVIGTAAYTCKKDNNDSYSDSRRQFR